MKLGKHISILTLIILIFNVGISQAQGRFVRKLQEEAEKRAVEEIFGKGEESRKASEKGDDSFKSRGHSREGGLSVNAPDVGKAIQMASDAFTSKDFKTTRYEIREALWGVELEMGHSVLSSLPAEIGSLAVVDQHDKVSSSGVGFLGLVIERVYENDDQQLVITVGNDSGIIGAAAALATSDAYRQTADQEQLKRIRFQERTAYIEYDESQGYSLTTPFGQSSVFILKGVNYESEKDFMAAAGYFNIDNIQQKLGEK